MFDRKHTVWNATIQSNLGNVLEREVRAYWDPEKVGTSEVAQVAAIEAHLESKTQQFAPISAELVTV